MNNPLVTIAIPTYKSTFLKESIQSALNQTYRNLEVIVVDDCSPESIESIVRAIKDNRISYYRNEKNLGGEDPGNNWNKCLSLSKGEYFCLLCDDDMYEPTFVEEMLKLAEKYPHTSVFRSRVKVVDTSSNIIDMYPSSPEFESSANYMLDMCGGFRRQTISEFMYRTDYIKSQGGYALLPKAMGSDHLTIYKLSENGGIASTIKPLVCFRSSTINLSGAGQNKKNIFEKIIACKMLTDNILRLAEKEPEDIRALIKKRRRMQHNQANVHELTYSSLPQVVHLYKVRKKYDIADKSFIKGFINKIRNILR